MSFQARYRGRCAACDDPIEPGQDVRYDEDDELVHDDHDSDPDHTDEHGQACPDCWTIHRGECL